MERVIWISFFLAFITMYSCTSRDEEVVLKDSESVYELVGRLHNEGLEYVFDRLTEARTKSNGILEVDTETIRGLCKQFVEKQGYETKGFVLTRSDNKIMDYRKLDFELSEQQNVYLSSVQQIINESTIETINLLVDKLKSLELEIECDCVMSNYEKEVLFYGIAVCCYSARYWVDNYEKWMQEFKNSGYMPWTKTSEEYVVSQSWWEKNKHIVTADGWWAMQGFLQSGSSGIPWYIIGMTLGEGIAGSVLAALGD